MPTKYYRLNPNLNLATDKKKSMRENFLPTYLESLVGLVSLESLEIVDHLKGRHGALKTCRRKQPGTPSPQQRRHGEPVLTTPSSQGLECVVAPAARRH